MIALDPYKGRNMAVLGLARSGMAAARALAAAGAHVIAWDDAAPAREAAVGKGLALGDLYAADWPSIDALVLSPGIPLSHPEPHPLVCRARAAGRPVIGDIELFAVALGAPPRPRIVAVTGTNGKSTTAALIGHILASCGRDCAVAGNIGTPVLSLDGLGDDGIYVLEMSSYQIDLSDRLRPDIAVLLNITPDHLERHGGLAGYVAAKRRLFDLQGPGDTAIIGIDDEHGAGLWRGLGARRGAAVMPVSTDGPIDGGIGVADGLLYDGISSPVAAVGDVSLFQALPGRHNWQNIAAAFAVARVLGLGAGEIMAALARFGGLAHRLETVAVIDGVRFINDSKATNAEAAARGLAAFDNIHWIAGGRPKAGGIDALTGRMGRVRRAYLIGEAADGFAATLGGAVDCLKCGTLSAAVARAAADAAGQAGAVVLLSPACASFDQFDDFAARGDAFRRLARALVSSAEALA